ncbi:MAG TPA: type II secretion system minor pseudopilin GspJ [Gammaproteobacteria bacterium]|nr:type II secretion system minor pseudopilin GspJ [Gammaproteobacteria bacterium]
MLHRKTSGFTLVEILVALFIFTILSLMMAGGLRTVINAQSGTEHSAERLRQLQLVFVRMSRDLEQTVNRPVKLANGKDASAFFGAQRGFAFTHGGKAGQSSQHQVLQRTQYSFSRNALWRVVWDVLDQSSNSPKPSQREVFANVSDVRFEYLDDKNVFHKDWPVSGNSNQPLPRAVRITLTIPDWGTVKQIYVIPAQNVNPAAPKQQTTPQP